MRDTLIGLTTMIILFSMVWLSQSNESASKNIVETDKHSNVVDSDKSNTVLIENDKSDEKIKDSYTDQKEAIAPCELCDESTEVSDNFTFGEAFNFCRQCLGDDGVFLWNSKLYTTDIKTVVETIELSDKNDVKENLVENETTESNTPPKSNTESVVSK